MTTRPVTVGPDDSLTAAAELIMNRGVRHVLVADGSEVVGVVSIRDLLPVVTDPAVPAREPGR